MKIIKILLISMVGVNLCYSAQAAQDGQKKEANPFGYTQDRQKEEDERLMYAIRACDLKTIKKLLNDKSIDINAKDNRGNTALIWTSYFGYKKIVELLIGHPAIDVNIQNNYGNTALIFASKHGRQEVVELLLDYGVDANIKNINGHTALIMALVQGHKKIVELLTTYQNEYLPYKIKELNKIRHENIKQTTELLPDIINIINEYAGPDFDKQNISNKNLLTFSQFLEQKDKEGTSKENVSKKFNTKNSRCNCIIQ